MKEVDYTKLSEQYAGFLVAVGGVSITVLALVLGLSSPPNTANEHGEDARLFLVAALTAATVSCFIGAHMMAETAAFFTYYKEKLPERTPLVKLLLGRRLFVLASSNIFIAISLVLFSIVLLPTATGKVELTAGLKLIFHVVFLGVLIGSLCWMGLAAIDRAAVGRDGWKPMLSALLVGLLSLGLGYISKELLPQLTFIIIVSFTAVSLLYFAILFKVGKFYNRKGRILEVGFFASAITISYVFLAVAYFKIL
jgi:hypothetical protein